jgi:hypothetical protein
MVRKIVVAVPRERENSIENCEKKGRAFLVQPLCESNLDSGCSHLRDVWNVAGLERWRLEVELTTRGGLMDATGLR